MLKLYRSGVLVSLIVAAALAGCREAETITTYETERVAPRAKAVDVDRVRSELDHMLVAIVPHGEIAWFFKVVARGDAVEKLRKPFEEFVGSVELVKAGETPKWKLPEGWTEKPGDKMRTATIGVPHEGGQLELTVVKLPLSGQWDAYLKENVDRWLEQLQQQPLSEKDVAGLTRSLPFKGGEATFLELVGVMEQNSRMMPPGHPQVASGVPAATASSSRPADSTPRPAQAVAAGAATTPAAEFAKPAEFTYEPPAGWQPGPTSTMRKAAFVVSEGNQKAEVTVMPFPASGAMADPTAQAQRWAGQAGLQLSEDELKAATKEVTIGGAEGQQFELLGAETGEAPVGILAAMVRRGEQMWFFKMTGDRALVEKQREAFGKFVESVKFSGDAQ
jgi:hypothetical protein